MALYIEENQLKELLENEYRKGFTQGIKLMEQRLLLASENGTPVEISGKAWFISSDIQNLQGIFEDLGADVDYRNKRILS